MRTVGQIINAVKSNLSSLGSPLANFSQYSNLYALLRAVSAVITEQDFNIATAKEGFYVTTAVSTDLDRRGLDYGLLRKTGTPSKGNILVSSSNPTALPKSLLLTSVNQLQFELQLTELATASEITLPITSLGNGTGYNLEAGTRLYSSLFPSVNFTVGSYRLAGVAQVGLESGTNPESDDEFRNRITKHLRCLGKGNLEAIETAVLGVPGISKAFVKEHTPTTGYLSIFIANTDSEVVDQVDSVIRTVKPAGVAYLIRQISLSNANVSFLLKLDNFRDSSLITSQVQVLINNYFSQLDLGETVYPSTLQTLPLNVEGVLSATLLSPTNPLSNPEGLITLNNLSLTLQN